MSAGLWPPEWLTDPRAVEIWWTGAASIDERDPLAAVQCDVWAMASWWIARLEQKRAEGVRLSPADVREARAWCREWLLDPSDVADWL